MLDVCIWHLCYFVNVLPTTNLSVAFIPLQTFQLFIDMFLCKCRISRVWLHSYETKKSAGRVRELSISEVRTSQLG